jgi:glycosyltransferase involved in cell wall biosynthesis
MNNLKKKITPLISIIVPTYNHAMFIKKAIISVKNQTYKNWELIIIDNFSTDNTQKVIKNFRDKRLKYYKIKNDGIIAKSRNFGIKFSKGEWIAFLDSDDYWIENKLEICVKNINEKVDFIYHDLESVCFKKFFFKKKIIGRSLKKPILKDLLVSTISKGTPIANSSVMIRKKILIKIKGINENKKLIASEDYNTWLRAAQITDNFKYINLRLGFFLIHEGSTQKKKKFIYSSKRGCIKFFKLA